MDKRSLLIKKAEENRQRNLAVTKNFVRVVKETIPTEQSLKYHTTPEYLSIR